MLESLSQANDHWAAAVEALEELDRSSRQTTQPDAFYDQVLASLGKVLATTGSELRIREPNRIVVLAKHGDMVSADQAMLISHPLVDDFAIELACQGADTTSSYPRQMVEDFLSSLLDLCAYVYLANGWRAQRGQQQQRTEQAAFLERLFPGRDLLETSHSICAAIADRTLADRVSLFRWEEGNASLLSISTQPSVDRRARQVRLLERVASLAGTHEGPLSFTVGETSSWDGELGQAVLACIDESGARQLVSMPLRGTATEGTQAMLVSERFQLDLPTGSPPLLAELSALQPLVQSGVDVALRSPGASSRLSRMRAFAAGGRLRWIVATLCIALAALMLVPVPFSLPVEGTIEPTSRQRVFAPVGGLLSELPVGDGQRVAAGTTLAVIQSPDVQLRYETAVGELGVAEAELASLRATKSGVGAATDSAPRRPIRSADEYVLRARIKSLEDQIDLLDDVRQSLTMRAKFAGRVVRWDRNRDLVGRNLRQGQLIVDVVATADGYYADLELPDEDYAYLLDRWSESRGNAEKPLNDEPLRSTLRLRSDPEAQFTGSIDYVADSVHLNQQGQGVIRVTMPLEMEPDREIPLGATVLGQIDCGRRPLGFVMFRPVIEWARSQAW